MARLVGPVRLVHPFPSLLDGLVVALVATVAGAGPSDAGRLGLSMTLLQFSIGALNDVTDARLDGRGRRGKPIPAGDVTPGAARLIAGASAAAGLLLAVPGGAPLVALAFAGLALGYVYDLRAKGTALSWLPLALGIPLLPVYGWYGAAGTLPEVFLALVPIAAVEGAALAIANAVVDLERDRASGSHSIAVRLGAVPSALAVLGLQLLVAVLAAGTAMVAGAPGGWLAATVLASAVPLGGALLGAASSMRSGPALREVAWEVQAVGAGLLAVSWLGGMSAAGGL